MAVSVGDVFAFALEQQLFGQQVINTFACKVTQTPGGVAESTWVDNWFADATGYFNTPVTIRPEILDMQTAEVTHVQWMVHRVQPNPTQVFLRALTTDVNGTMPGSCETGNISMSITRKGLAAGRRSKGRIAIAGIPISEYAGGVFGAGILSEGNDVGVLMCGLHTRVAGDQVEMGFWSPAHSAVVGGVTVNYPAQFVPCVTSQAQATVRVQRSRTIGVGS